MNISLTKKLEKWVQNKVRSGLYNSSSEVVREALRQMYENDRLRELGLIELRRKIEKGLQSLDAGKGLPFDDSLTEEIKKEGRKRRGDGEK